MKVRTRFAPSPSGFLHLGGGRTALYNWLLARKHGGQFVIRVEDTDQARSTEKSKDVILNNLRWLNLDWDEGPEVGGDYGPYFQSERTEIYDSYLQKLEDGGHVEEDENGAIRFKVPDKDITVNDLVSGDVTVNLKVQGSTRFDAELKKEVEADPNFIIRRPDGSYIFHFVNVVDDIEMEISHVVRGKDHLTNTTKHIALFEALDKPIPEYAHIPLTLNLDGTKMSKRDQGALLDKYEEQGYLPSAVNNYMALLGWSDKDEREIFLDIDELIKAFDLDRINSANSKFDETKCKWVNAEHIKAQSPEDLLTASAPFLEKANIDPDDDRVPASLELARERAETLTAVPTVIAPAFFDEITYDPASVKKVKDKAVIEKLADSLAANDDWTVDGIKTSIKEAAKEQGAKMGAFMLPCRVATMGSTQGADLVPMLVLMGKDKVIARLQKFPEQMG